MSADPFENTTTVKNILQHVISPKVVSDGISGYIVRTDLVHIHNIIFEKGTATEDGTSGNPFTTQCGTVTTVSGSLSSPVVYHSRVTSTSIVFATIMSGSSSMSISRVIPNLGSFIVSLSSAPNTNTIVGWFIAKF